MIAAPGRNEESMHLMPSGRSQYHLIDPQDKA
jgi:hypothetical protein